MVDFGTPLAGGVRVTTDGTSPSTREVAGYSIIEATDLDAALALAKSHPHLNMPGGCEIEVHEAQATPACDPLPRCRIVTVRPRGQA